MKWFWSLLLFCAGCHSGIPAPPPMPDTGTLLSDYVHPTGNLKNLDTATLVSKLLAQVQTLDRLQGLYGLVTDLDQRASEEEEDDDYGDDDYDDDDYDDDDYDDDDYEYKSLNEGLAVREQAMEGFEDSLGVDVAAKGWIKVQWICPGDDNNKVDKSKGYIELYLVAPDFKLDDMDKYSEKLSKVHGYGVMRDCALALGDGERRYDGDFAIFFVKDYDHKKATLFYVSLVESDGRSQTEFQGDFEALSDGWRMRYLDSSGSLLFGLQGNENIEVIDRNGRWNCSIQGNRCQSAGGQSP